MQRIKQAAQATSQGAGAARNVNPTQQYTHTGAASTSDSVPAGETRLALGALLLYIVGRELPRREERTAWGLVEKWLGRLVEGKHSLKQARTPPHDGPEGHSAPLESTDAARRVAE